MTDEPTNAPADAPAPAGTVAIGDAAPKADASPPDWRAALGDDLRPKLEKFTSSTDLAKSYVELQAMVGKRVAVPDENATPEQVAAFREKLGVPKTPGEYKLAVPANLPEGVVDVAVATADLQKYAALAHQHGIPPKQMQEMVNQFYADQVAATQQAAGANAARTEQAVNKLFAEWGGDKDANITYAQRAVKQFDTDGQFTAFLAEAKVDGIALGNHPMFLKLFARAGRAMAEDGAQLEPSPTEMSTYRSQADEFRQKRKDAMAKGDRRAAEEYDQAERAVLAKMGRR